jgi:hypothetical protein
MKTYLLTVPLAPGKTEAWKQYMKELTGPRNDEYKKSRKRAGIKVEQVFLQQTAHGDMCVVMLGGDNPQKSLESMMTSNDPFDKWFREKVLIEAHGLDMSQPMPQNQQISEYSETSTREFAGTK